MDFFERQDQARRHTSLLLIYFVLAVLCIIGSVYLAALIIFGSVAGPPVDAQHGVTALWNADIFTYSALGTLAVIVFGSLYQISALSSGGSAVAESLGGRQVSPGTTDTDERKLLNVVEEMSIASGVPLPRVYVLDGEAGINAFAAGFSSSDAVVTVTRGAMEKLTRDELQGVVGHEFSHILNGDMRLNLRLMGVIFGILCLSTIGRILLRTRGRRNPLPLLGLALLLIGAIGVFFGRLIQAAVSRQREFLADAASVQFTRNPAGLSGALQKIGAVGSQLESERAADACHMFFGNGLRRPFFSLFATHPPIDERIRAIDPSWDGKFKPLDTFADRGAIPEGSQRQDQDLETPVFALSTPRPARPAPDVAHVRTALASLGNPAPMHLRYAERLRDALPDSLRSATRDPLTAQALVFAMLLSEEKAKREEQLQGIADRMGAPIRSAAADLYPEVEPLETHARLPLVNLLLPALRLLQPEELQRLRDSVKWLVESDQKIELFEFMLLKILQRNLAPRFAGARPAVVQFYSMKPLVADAAVVLSALANVGGTDEAEVAAAFQAGAPFLRAGEAALLPSEQCGLDRVSDALDRLALAVPQIKRNILEASVHVVGADGWIQEHEAELLRAIAEVLDCPIPPFVTME